MFFQLALDHELRGYSDYAVDFRPMLHNKHGRYPHYAELGRSLGVLVHV